ncbi:hypothetical protein JCM10213_007415 [Rhodosporidiobolus nylandii]
MAVAPASASATSQPPVRIQLFHQSSQYRNWRYAKDGLEKVRQELNTLAVDRVRHLWEEERAQQAVAPTPAPANSSATASPAEAPSPSEIEYLTVADELSLVTYYLAQSAAMCGAFQFPELVSATAQTYLKRFYLRNTCMDYHPKNVMLTCVFLATKTENFSISIDTFAGRVKEPPSVILSLEFLVSQSLRFEYKVHHAHLALQGLILDMQAAGVDLATLTAAAPKAHALVRASRLTSVEFIYTPAQIALACFRLAEPSLADKWLGAKEERLEKGKGKEGEDAGGTSQEQLEREALLMLLDELQVVVSEAQKNPVDKKRAADVDKRLKLARNPEKDPNSALYKKRKAEEEAAREAKELARAAKNPLQDDGSVFD